MIDLEGGMITTVHLVGWKSKERRVVIRDTRKIWRERIRDTLRSSELHVR